jgi:phosphoglycolate phosphatase-like HAD superfamily hydrolase
MQAVILSERALADTDDLFAAAVAHVARKLGRVKPLDPETLAGGRAGTIRALDEWAGSEIDWRAELGRFYEDHIPVHLRPNPALNAVLRGLQASGVRLACWSPGPEEGIRIVIHHLGLARRVEAVGVGESADVAARLAHDLSAPPDQTVVVSGDPAQLASAAERGFRTATPAELDGLVSGNATVTG